MDTQYRGGRSERDPEGFPKLTETEQYLLGQLYLDGQAFIGHRNLLDVIARVQLGYEQTDVDSDIPGADRNDHDFRTLYDVSGLILGERPAPLTIYSRREETRLEWEFAGTIDSENTEHGARVNFRSSFAPTSLHYVHRQMDQVDNFGTVDYHLVQVVPRASASRSWISARLARRATRRTACPRGSACPPATHT